MNRNGAVSLNGAVVASGQVIKGPPGANQDPVILPAQNKAVLSVIRPSTVLTVMD